VNPIRPANSEIVPDETVPGGADFGAGSLVPFTYDLPETRIAQRPVVPYDEALLMVVERSAGTIRDSRFTAAAEEIRRGDLLVFNNTKVLPARFFGAFRDESGKAVGSLEVFLLRPDPISPAWRCIGQPLKKCRVGRILDFPRGLSARVIGKPSDEEIVVEFFVSEGLSPQGSSLSPSGPSLEALMHEVGTMPIPPYIRDGVADEADRVDYQTMFAQHEGSIAAPTASLHFTPRLMDALEEKGAQTECLTLHVGAASIRRVEREGVLQRPGPEKMVVPHQVLEQVRKTKAEKGRVIAVGTTVARALESAARQGESSGQGGVAGDTDLFITPGFKFEAVDALFTNFHQPGTTHLLLVEAFIGRELLERSYARALAGAYRFLSYGDGTLLV